MNKPGKQVRVKIRKTQADLRQALEKRLGKTQIDIQTHKTSRTFEEKKSLKGEGKQKGKWNLL